MPTKPWQVLAAGLVFGVFSGSLVAVGYLSETPDLFVLAWVLASVAGPIVFVELVAMAVELGVRAAGH